MSLRSRLVRHWSQDLRPVIEDGHEVCLLQGGDQYFPALVQAIGAARDQVSIESYLFEDDAAGRAVAAALAAAAQRGVSVRVAVDGYGTPMIAGQAGEMLRSAGVRIGTFRPERRWLSLDRRRLRRLHRKIALIDDRIAFIGGINIVDDHSDPNHGALDAPRLDFAVRLRGPALARIRVAVGRLWSTLDATPRIDSPVRSQADRQPARDAGGAFAASGSARVMFVLRDNFRFRRAIERQYLRAIHGARHQVLIACAYFFPGRRFRQALVAAARRGVRVRLLLQGRIEYLLPHYAAQAFYDELLSAGVEIIEYRRSFLHAKVAVFDDSATVGSSNIDPFSLLLAREANLFVFDPAFADRLRADLEAAIDAGGVPVLAVHHARRAWTTRLMNRLALGLLRFALALALTDEPDPY